MSLLSLLLSLLLPLLLLLFVLRVSVCTCGCVFLISCLVFWLCEGGRCGCARGEASVWSSLSVALSLFRHDVCVVWPRAATCVSCWSRACLGEWGRRWSAITASRLPWYAGSTLPSSPADAQMGQYRLSTLPFPPPTPPSPALQIQTPAP